MRDKITLNEWRKRKRPAEGFRYVICSIKQLRDAKKIEYRRVNSRLYQLIASDGKIVHAVIVDRNSHALKSTSPQKKGKPKPSHSKASPTLNTSSGGILTDVWNTDSAKKRTSIATRIRARPNKIHASSRCRTRIMHYEEDKPSTYTDDYRIRANNSSHIDKDTFNHPGEGTKASAAL